MIPDAKLPAEELIACFNESQDCVKIIDTDATILSFNDNGYKVMEIDNPRDVLGKDWLGFWTDDMNEPARAAFAKACSGHIGYFEGECPTMKGSKRWWQVTIVPLKDNYGDINWLLAISRDVTELYDLRKEVAALKQRAKS